VQPYFDDGDLRLYCGDAAEVLRELPDRSVHMACTSPPFFGLRDYGTGAWEGGDEGCDHIAKRGTQAVATGLGYPADGGPRRVAEGNTYEGAFTEQFKTECGKCGARRIDSQIGLESSPDAWAARLVDVFREVRRVLRDDGTLWVECGSSFVSSGTRPSRSQPPPSAPAYGNGDIELPGSQEPDSAYPDLCDGCRAEILSHRDHSADTDPQPLLVEPQPELTDRDSELSDSALASLAAEPPAVLASSTPDDVPSRLRASTCAACGAPLDTPASRPLRSAPGALAFARNSAYSGDTTPPQRTSEAHISGKEPLALAWGDYTSTLKPKDLLLQPFMLAMSLQADGWYLRSCIIWSRPNCMPESCTDRPTQAHSYVFLFSKKPRYFYDAEALREPAEWARWGDQTVPKHDGTATASGWIQPRTRLELQGYVQTGSGSTRSPTSQGEESQGQKRAGDGHIPGMTHPAGKNARTVWTIPTEPNALAICRVCDAYWQGGAPREHCGEPVVQHFAAFPRELVRRMILAGTSEHGVCAECGAPWVREVERTRTLDGEPYAAQAWPVDQGRRLGPEGVGHWRKGTATETLGWHPSCGQWNGAPRRPPARAARDRGGAVGSVL